MFLLTYNTDKAIAINVNHNRVEGNEKNYDYKLQSAMTVTNLLATSTRKW